MYLWRNILLILMSQTSNKDIKKEYGWLPKGIISQIINQLYSGSKSLIAESWSNGEFVWAMLNETVNSNWFQQFFNYKVFFET